MSILTTIVDYKKEEVAHAKESRSIAELEKLSAFEKPCVSSVDSLSRAGASGIIAEFKRRSPSKGGINELADVEQVTHGYVQAGASVLSVLTDAHFFGGGLQYMRKARAMNPNTPILRKDFTIDEYQILEAKAEGADLILLIASVLDPNQTSEFARFAKSLGLEVLLEVHDKEELERHVNEHVDLVGVNNRNLGTFKTDVQTSFALSELIPNDFIKVSESGIHSADTINDLRGAGYRGFLIGEYFMRHDDPAQACETIVKGLRLESNV